MRAPITGFCTVLYEYRTSTVLIDICVSYTAVRWRGGGVVVTTTRYGTTVLYHSLLHLLLVLLCRIHSVIAKLRELLRIFTT